VKSKKVLAALLTAMLATSVLAGCGTKTETTPPTSTPGSEVKIDADQTLNVLGYDFTSLDTARVSDAESITVIGNVFEGLVRETSKDGKIVTELAEAKEIKKNADGTVYTITLRDGIQWTDGKPVTAKDYEYSWKKLADPAVSVDYLTLLGDEGMVKGASEFAAGTGKREDVGVKALDDKTLEVTLKQPNPYFESFIAFKLLAPQREDIDKALGEAYGQEFSKMVFNGPFVISEYAKGSKMVFKKNEKYYDADKVKLTTVNMPIINEPATLVKMFEGKELDQTGASGDNIKKLDANKDAGGYQHITGYTSSTFYLIFNQKNAALKSPKVRLGISLGFDRQEYLDVVYKRFVPSYGLVPKNIMLGTDEFRSAVPSALQAVKEDPKQLVADGLKELGLTADQAKVKLLLGPATSTSTATAQYFQNKLKALGITVEIVHAVDSPTYFKERNAGNFDMVAGGWGADYNDVASYFSVFMPTSGNNNAKYNNAKYAEAVAKAGKELDPKKRLEFYKEAERIITVEDPGFAPTYYQDVHSFRYNYVKGMYLPTFGGYYDLKNVYIQGKQ
jgi:oligopeptide transport system substrate-binding protein